MEKDLDLSDSDDGGGGGGGDRKKQPSLIEPYVFCGMQLITKQMSTLVSILELHHQSMTTQAKAAPNPRHRNHPVKSPIMVRRKLSRPQPRTANGV